MTDRPARLDDLLEFVSAGLATEDPLPPHGSIALDVLTDVLVEGETPSPASAFVAAKYVFARHAREMADLLIGRPVPKNVDPRHWGAAQLREYAARLDGQAARRPAAETLIGSITIRTESVQLDTGECLRDLAVGDSVELRADTGHEGLWVAATFHGRYQDWITLQYAEVIKDCGSDPAIACKFSGTRHAHPVDLDGKVRPRPGATAEEAQR